MLFAIIGARRKQAFFASVENIKFRKIKQSHFLTMKHYTQWPVLMVAR